MGPESSYDTVMARLRAGDARAAALVFERFAHRLVALAQRRLDRLVRRKVDAEDVLQSVFRSFFARQAAGQFDANGWEGLWGLLVVLTVRKCGRQARYFHQARRDIFRESVPAEDGDARLVAWDRAPTPEEAAGLADLLEQLLERCSEAERDIVRLCLEGHTQPDISAHVGCTERTVRRVLTRVRERLQKLAGAPEPTR